MYYPLTQITTNLYTNGNEYVYSSSKDNYIGYYWKTSTGKIFTGKTPQDGPIQELIPILDYSKNLIPQNSDIPVVINQEDVRISPYTNRQNIDINQIRLLPVYNPNIPTNDDYQIGEYRRYFCKKANEIIYLEIDKITYDKLINKDPKILYQYYQPFNIPWQLIGDKTQTYKINKNIVELTMKQQKLPMFDKYLQEDYVKYYK